MRHQTYIHENVLNTKVKQYLMCQQLGQGASSKVYLAIRQDTNEQYAIKVISKSYLNTDKKLMQLVKTQIYILKSCNNENVIKCYDVFQSTQSIFIVMEYCNGLDMEQYVKKKKYLSQDHAVWFLKQMLNGFKGLHEVGAMHRDFKLPNLLLHDRVCKIADLGFAKQMKQQQLTSTILGTQITMAPQVLQRKPYGINADIWSLGVVFYQMLTGRYPYKGANTNDLIKNIKSKAKDFSNMRISRLAKNFIQGCLTYDPSARMKWMQIYNHPLLNKTTIQLTYGISNATQIFYQNQQFYRAQSLDQREDSLIILRTSARKQIIIQEIQEIQERTVQCAAVYRNSMEISEHSKVLVRYGINYGIYLNQLSYPMKFIDAQQAQCIQNIDHFTPIYLIYKKVYNQIRQFDYIIKKRINIFKIQVLWKQFLKCSIYTDLTNIVKNCLQRAQKLFIRAQRTLKGMQPPQIQYDDRISKQITQQGVNRKQFLKLHEQYLYKYAKSLMKCLVVNQNESKESVDLLEVSEGLLYYMDKAGKDKLTPERFDWSRSRSINYRQERNNLIGKFQLLLSY